MTDPTKPSAPAPGAERAEFFDAMKKGLVLGAGILVIALPVIIARRHAQHPLPPQQVLAQPARAAAAADPAPVPAEALPAVAAAKATQAAPGFRPVSFGSSKPTDPVKQIANWTMHSGDHEDMGFVIIDKKDARVWVFTPSGELRGNAPALLGAAIGDDTVPGIGDRPLKLVKPEEKTTPAGRFVAEAGINTGGEDVVWVDYDAAVSMHRVRPLVAAERRLERLASPTPEDNRISFGCINLPPQFYENVVRDTVRKWGAVVYVLPETRSPKQVFGNYDVTAAADQIATR